MAIEPFLAMTAAEMRMISEFPTGCAWMACHFSPYGLGLSNLPRALPPDALLILNDRTPIHGHDAGRITEQLIQCMEALGCWGLLLDFQQPGDAELRALAKHLAQALPCPVGVSDLYAGDVECPVFLPPVPPSVPLEAHLAPWQDREIWLEMALGGEVITLTEKGAETQPLPFCEIHSGGHWDEMLHCHYHADVLEDAVTFTLWRTQEDLESLLDTASHLGVTTAVGLYQELKTFAAPKPPPGTRINS